MRSRIVVNTKYTQNKKNTQMYFNYGKKKKRCLVPRYSTINSLLDEEHTKFYVLLCTS